MMLKGKKIILGVTGSISAYKAILLLRLLVKEEAEVQVIMTEKATEFVSELTFSTLLGKRVMVNFFEDNNWENHALLGRWADLILVAPASAQTISKMANGLCDNLLSAVYLSASSPVMVAPAMDADMWQHLAVRRNIQRLIEDGVKILKVNKGLLASGLTGWGRLGEPEEILEEVKAFFSARSLFENKKVLITSGPTREPLDPVRFISNRSSGKMGAALAEAFLQSGAEVTVVSGPSNVSINDKARILKVNTAGEMYDATIPLVEENDVIIMTAAVSDYTPLQTSAEKIKKNSEPLSLTLTQTKDILAEAGKMKRNRQILVGFALETINEKQNAIDKLNRKNADFMILNSLKDEGAGFGLDTNKITIFGKNGEEKVFPLKSKAELANEIVNFLSDYL